MCTVTAVRWEIGLQFGFRTGDSSILLRIFHFDQSSNARPVLKGIRLFFKAVASQARNQNRPKIPVDDTANESAHGYGQHISASPTASNLQSTTHDGVSSIPEPHITSSVLRWDERRHDQTRAQGYPQPDSRLPGFEGSFQVRSGLPEPQGTYADGQGEELGGVAFHVEDECVHVFLRGEGDD